MLIYLCTLWNRSPGTERLHHLTQPRARGAGGLVGCDVSPLRVRRLMLGGDSVHAGMCLLEQGHRVQGGLVPFVSVGPCPDLLGLGTIPRMFRTGAPEQQLRVQCLEPQAGVRGAWPWAGQGLYEPQSAPCLGRVSTVWGPWGHRGRPPPLTRPAHLSHAGSVATADRTDHVVSWDPSPRISVRWLPRDAPVDNSSQESCLLD